jgi:alpha-methylacyl-CoA racemase
MLPLTGIRVLDLTRHLPGPYSTDLLRRLGAEVIKIEPPAGDPTRWLPPMVDGTGALYALVNAGKKSVVVDLKDVSGRDFLQRIAATCDVVVESYRPGASRGMGFDYETLRRVREDIVYCSISGYGSEMPRSAHDLNFVALAGLLDLQRDEEGRPVLPSTQIGDMGGALFGALSILAALFERQRTGAGRRIDISMADATRAMMPTAESLYRGTHQSPEMFLLTGASPRYNIYRTRDGKYIAAAPLEPQFWREFCRVIGRPDLAEWDFATGSSKELEAAVAAAVAGRTRAEWEALFADVDACVEPVLTIEEAHSRFGDPMLGHPLQRNFGAAIGGVVPLGGSLQEVVESLGLSTDELTSDAESGARERKPYTRS